MKLWPIFVLGAAVSWGLYVPVLHQGQAELGKNSALRAFLCVGIAYFLTAVLLPGGLLAAKVEPAAFTAKGVGFSIAAGVAGAAGALCVIFALKSGGRPLYVAPLIFAGAPIINTLVTMAWHRPASAPHPVFYAGIALAAVGSGLVLWFRPT